MKIQTIKNILKTFLFFSLLMLLFASCISSYIGYNGYEKWKYRRSTYGNRTESIDRKVFIKDLEYTSNLDLDNFNIYIEKGFKYGHNGDYQTMILENDKYPYQVSYDISIDKTNIYRYDDISLFKTNIDTMSSSYFLERPELDHPFIVKISKLVNKQWDSIGYIKVWDPDKIDK